MPIMRNMNLITVHFWTYLTIFTCSRLVYNTVYAYLPLFLTERLQFEKVITAPDLYNYFALKIRLGREVF